MSLEKKTTRTGTTWIEHGILRFEYATGAEVSLDDAKDNVVVELELCGGTGLPCLIDIAGAKSVDQDARNYYSECKKFPACALIGVSPIARIIGNIYLAVHGGGDTPTRMFRTETDAIAWLREYLPK